MRPSYALHAHRPEIRRIVTAHRATNARVFGSVSRGDDVEGSDIDLLIDPTANTTLFDIGAIRYELLKLFGHPRRRAHAAGPARAFSREGVGRGRPCMSAATPRLPDYLQHIIEAIERI